MAKLAIVSAKRVAAALKRLGFHEVRQTGSHLQLKRGNLLVSVPMHAGDLAPGTLRSILRQARLSVADLKDAL
jgi:predicted RNA binding protein YcfA (HicA-like mRNA interferase family)